MKRYEFKEGIVHEENYDKYSVISGVEESITGEYVKYSDVEQLQKEKDKIVKLLVEAIIIADLYVDDGSAYEIELMDKAEALTGKSWKELKEGNI